MRTFLEVSGTLTVLAFGTSIGVLSMTPPEYSLARGLMFGTALGLSLIGLFWAATTDTALWLKLGTGLFIVWFSVTGLPLSLALISAKESRGISAPAAENLSTLSDDELRQKSSELAQDLHAFEKDTSEHDPVILQAPLGRRDIPQARREEEWREYTNKITQFYSRRNIDFRRLYTARISALVEEIRSRLGSQSANVPPNVAFAIAGSLAGPAPISDVADYLLLLSAKLP